ncbi:alpha-2-macroglobulin receptor-associated protein [Bradysia coprophila]|uniref:alpha-2-macroglobulin receptor-associated protein n=1 Tax=Bradysia coprophila TaxID=38358 RepID=UPI00187DD6DD|nr:alpha-2-macroglobulin receptor-associated protein [Bradysia coprophila]
MNKVLLVQTLLVLVLSLSYCSCKKQKSKYSAEANHAYEPTEKYDPDFRTLQKPYRMAKLNLVWSKAVHRLTEPKLKSLFSELKIQDKEELNWKQSGGQHKDKDGLKEAELRKKLVGIMSTYGLLEHFDDTQDPEKYKHHKAYSGPVENTNYKNKSLFKDKKLNKLWEKAEVSGFTPEELNALKEEFTHHQEKVDLYYNLLDTVSSGKQDYHENAVNEDELDKFNEIMAEETNEVEIKPNVKNNNYLDSANLLRSKHQDIRDNFDRLERVAVKGPNSQEFIEPKVQGLWRMASTSNFTVDELASLKVELLHYESRLLKLRHLHAEHALNREKYKEAHHGSKHDKYASMDDHIKKQSRKVEKLQEHLEQKIFKHYEL